MDLLWLAFCLNSFLTWPDVCEYEKKMEEEYRYEVQELFIDHVLSKQNFTYALWCHGQPWCRNKYDCSGLMHSFLYENWIKERKINSSLAVSLSKNNKSVFEAKRWDLVYFSLYYGEGYPTHLAIVAKPYSGWYLSIIDNVSSDRRSTTERKIRIWKWWTYNLPDMGFRLIAIDNAYIDKYIQHNPLTLKECDNVCTNLYPSWISSMKSDAWYASGNKQQKKVNIFAENEYQSSGHREAASNLRELLSI